MLPGPVPGVSNAAPRLVRVSASFAGKPELATVLNITLYPMASDIEPRLRGPSGDVPVARAITLNATSSFDPDDPLRAAPLRFDWECRRSDYPVPCFSGINNAGNINGSVWSLPASTLTAGVEHTFTVLVSRIDPSTGAAVSGSEAAASLIMTPRAAGVPSGRIRRVCGPATCPTAHTAGEPLTLSLLADTGAETATITWRSDQVPSLSCAGSECTVPAALLPSAGAVTVVAELTGQGNVKGTTSLTVPINGVPKCAAAAGCLAVTVNSETFPTSSFTAEATGFEDDSPDLRCAQLSGRVVQTLP